mmetsp:Transcript_33240/g.50170  ORF Transcript_33240/g.50170 Transcript_33240/m.50170 type:complete len:175 (-) Transcript_33240:296-820(-)
MRDTPCADPLPINIDKVINKILQRTIATIDEQAPLITEVLFGCNSLTELLLNDQLKYSSREPAINIYTPGGEFAAHKDAQALTILLPLSCPEKEFAGGGTSFWSQDSRGHRVEAPSAILKPLAGTAMLFGGCVTHAGLPVESGTRVVFVASFSRKDGQQPVLIEEHRDIYGGSL